MLTAIILQILTEQQNGLQHLTKMLQGALKDLAIIEGKAVDQEDSALDSAFMASTSALRNTALR